MRLLFTTFFLFTIITNASPKILEVPDNGISPQCLTDSTGTTHMIYYKGTPQTGDIYYTILKKDSSDFSPSVRVNSIEGSAVAMGTIRAAQMALGKDNSVHVVWNGSKNAQGQFLYSRSLGNGKFSEQKDFKGATAHMDGGGSVATNGDGIVYIVWHANKKDTNGEENRRIFVAVSNDNGQTFAQEKAVSPEDSGICPCCSLKVAANGKELLILYRGAKNGSRDLYQLLSKDSALTFNNDVLGKWRTAQCPMSSHSIFLGSKGFLKAWESEGKIAFTSSSGEIITIPGTANKKHPVIVENSSGNLLIVWAEGTGWNKGGDLSWQEIDEKGKPLFKIETLRRQVKVWSTISAFAVGEQFYIVH